MTQKTFPPMAVKAQLVMGDTDPCWCRSGCLWTACHKGRGAEKPENFFQARVKLRREYERGYCSHPSAPGACGPDIIRSHSLQRNGALNRIAKKGHVYAVKAAVDSLTRQEGDLVPRKLGLKEASTFLGFCNKHDTEMFMPIETGVLPLDAQTAFLLSFRAVAYELFEKSAGVRGLKGLRPDAGQGIMEQERLVNALLPLIVGQEIGVEDISEWKARLDRAFLAGDHSGFELLAVEFDGLLPIVSTAAVQPAWAVGGIELQDLRSERLGKIVFCLTTRGANSVFVVCWSPEDGPVGKTFAERFDILPDEDKATAALLISLAYSENAFFAPDWWEGLTKAQQAWLIDLLAFGIPGRTRLTPEQALTPKSAPVRLDYKVAATVRT